MVIVFKGTLEKLCAGNGTLRTNPEVSCRNKMVEHCRVFIAEQKTTGMWNVNKGATHEEL